jgi:non-specific serine/threonine protein kinase/serine/threonine-protein kinase
VKPSVQLATDGLDVAHRRRTEPAALRRRLHGDLDWIALKALERERSRRYATVSALADDVRRHLTHQPVEVGPPSALYLLRKAVARHKTAFVAMAAVIAALLIGLLASLSQRNRAQVSEADARAQSIIAKDRADEAEDVANFHGELFVGLAADTMGETILRAIRRRAEQGLRERLIKSDHGRERRRSEEEITADLAQMGRLLDYANMPGVAVDLLDQSLLAPTSKSIGEQFSDRPWVEERLRNSLANLYIRYGQYDTASKKSNALWN